MNVIFTCGGTGGHINPAIAVADTLKARHPECNILFIGAKGHMEEQLVPRAGYRLETLPGSGLSRKLNWAGIKKNAKAAANVLTAVSQCNYPGISAGCDYWNRRLCQLPGTVCRKPFGHSHLCP